MISRYRWLQKLASMTVIVVGGGCGDSVLSPSVLPPSEQLSAPAGILSSRAEEGDVLTLYDEVGNAFTLNVNAQELLRHSDGLVMELGLERTAEMLSAFHTIIAGDYLVSSHQGDLVGPCDRDPDPNCIEPYSSGSSSITLRHVSRGETRHFGGRFGSWPRFPRSLLRRGSRAGQSGVETMSTTGSGDCYGIAGAIAEKVPAYEDSKRIFWNALKAFGYPIEMVDGSPRIRIDDYFEMAIALDQSGLRMRRMELELNILATMYRYNNCFNNDWPDWTDMGGAGSTSGSGSGSTVAGGGEYRLGCYEDKMELSFDGGETWHEFEVTICDWVATM